MSASSTVSQYLVTPAITQANTDATSYVANQTDILNAASTVAAALLAAGEPQGAPVLAVVPVIAAAVAAFPAQLTAAGSVAEQAF